MFLHRAEQKPANDGQRCLGNVTAKNVRRIERRLPAIHHASGLEWIRDALRERRGHSIDSNPAGIATSPDHRVAATGIVATEASPTDTVTRAPPPVLT